jgi:hypothetical protein
MGEKKQEHYCQQEVQSMVTEKDKDVGSIRRRRIDIVIYFLFARHGKPPITQSFQTKIRMDFFIEYTR